MVDRVYLRSAKLEPILARLPVYTMRIILIFVFRKRSIHKNTSKNETQIYWLLLLFKCYFEMCNFDRKIERYRTDFFLLWLRKFSILLSSYYGFFRNEEIHTLKSVVIALRVNKKRSDHERDRERPENSQFFKNTFISD